MNRTFCAYFIIVGILVAVSTNVFGQTTEQDVLERLLKVEQEQLGLMKYQMQSTSPAIAAALSFMLPFGFGHAYGSKNWERGLTFFIAEAGLTVVGMLWAPSYDDTKEAIGIIMLIASPVVKITEVADSYIQAQSYNQRLQSRYRLNLSFGKEQGQIQLSYAF